MSAIKQYLESRKRDIKPTGMVVDGLKAYESVTDELYEVAAAELAEKDAELTRLREELGKRNRRIVEQENAALTERVGRLEAENKWWLENYDITMPCGHKNRYLDVNVKGEIVRDENGDGVCTMCIVEAQ